MLKNDQNSYGTITKLLHWLISIGIITMLTVGFYMSDLEDSDAKYQIYDLHKASGVVLLFFITLRLSWRLMNQSVKPIESIPQMIQILAKMGHFFLYILMFLMPISGILMVTLRGRSINVYDLFTIDPIGNDQTLAKFFYFVHESCALVLAITVSLHVAFALYHHFIRKDNTLKRML